MWETDRIGQPVVVEDLDADRLLSVLADKEAEVRRGERGKLRLAVQWCVLHPATADTGVATWEDANLPGVLGTDESLGGQGTPAVSAFAPEPFAAALGVSTMTGMALIADALDLVHRLPRIHAVVEALEVPVWKARKVAQATHALSQDAAAYVDVHLAPVIASCGFARIEHVLAMAIAKYHPELLATREKRGRESWHVTLRHPSATEFAGTSSLDVVGDTLDLTRFHDLVLDQAAVLAALGDTDTLDIRKAKAIGVIADHQGTLELPLDTRDKNEPDTHEQGTSVAVRRRTPATLYLHLSLSELLALPDVTSVGEVERLGAVTEQQVRDWLTRASTAVTIRPVLDLTRTDAVDQHDPPDWMRELVILRDQRCVFPWCNRTARACDLDHVVPYVDPDDGGPPGQTNPENLAALCRRHHRAKTAGRWRYERQRDGTYLWHGPHHRTYLVTMTATRLLRDF